MSALDLILGKGKPGHEIGTLKLDVTNTVSHQFKSTVSKNPIEDQTDIADNIKLENRMLTIDAMIAGVPFDDISTVLNVFTGSVGGQLASGLGGLGGQVGQAVGGALAGLVAGRVADDRTFPQRAYDYLKQLWQDKEKIDIVTNLETYSNMYIVDLSVPRTAADGDSLSFTATFERLQLVQTETVSIPEVSTVAGAIDKIKNGKKVATPASTKTGNDASILYGAIF